MTNQLFRYQKTRNQIGDQTLDVAGEMDDMRGEMVMIDGKPKEHTELDVMVGDGLEIAIGGKMKFQNSAKQVIDSVKVVQAVRSISENSGKPLILTTSDQQLMSNNKLLNHKDDDVISNNSNNSYKKPSHDVSRSSLLLDGDDKRISKENLIVGSATDLEGDLENATEEMDADKVETATADVIVNEYPVDCFPDDWYAKCPWCLEESTPWLSRWKDLRFNSYNLVENKYFETVCITLILISSMTLVSKNKIRFNL